MRRTNYFTISNSIVSLSMAILFVVIQTVDAFAQKKNPNILVIWGDDIGTWNISHNNRGMMGYQTPNIDKIQMRVLPLLIIMLNRAVLQVVLHLLAAPCLFVRV